MRTEPRQHYARPLRQQTRHCITCVIIVAGGGEVRTEQISDKRASRVENPWQRSPRRVQTKAQTVMVQSRVCILQTQNYVV